MSVGLQSPDGARIRRVLSVSCADGTMSDLRVIVSVTRRQGFLYVSEAVHVRLAWTRGKEL